MQPKLSPNDRALIASICERLITACGSTTTLDRDACIAAVRRAYRDLGLDEPEIVFVESPIAAMAELKRRTRSEPARAAADVPDVLSGLLGALPGSIAALMASAQPRKTAALGGEVDLGFNDELNRAMEQCARPLWGPVSKLIDKQLGNQRQFGNAGEHTLDEQVDPGDKWLIYSGGWASLWSSAEGLARVASLHAIGAIPALPAGFDAAAAVLHSCGCVNAFEKVCVVSDRPRELHQSGSARDPEGLRTALTWRDGATCELVFR